MFKKDGSGYIFKMSISDDPKSLDPQLASDESSIAIMRNMFVGLLKYDGQGSVAKGAANDYSISQDRLTYTFYLDERYEWKAVDGFSAPLTAHDFVFGFKRLFNPQTLSPYAPDYFCIKNSEAANSSAISIDEIGVKALDDYTLEITLEYPNAEFLSLLTRLPASPCNEEFFESCKGKYGLEAECIASNGPFYVRYWLHDKYGKENYVRLRRNDSYSKISRVYPSGVNFLVEHSESVRQSDFTDGTTDVLLSDYPSAVLEGFESEKLYKYSLGLVINPKNEILNRTEVKEVLSLSIDRNAVKSLVPDYFMTSFGLIPPAAAVGGTSYRSSVEESEIQFNQRLAEYKWSFLLTDSEKYSLMGITILIPNTFVDYKYLSEVTACWRECLGFNAGLEVLPQSDYEKRIKDGSYDICLRVLDSRDCSAFDYIQPFCGTSQSDSDDLISKTVFNSDKYMTLTAAIHDLNSCETGLIESYDYIPLWYMPRFVYVGSDSTDFITDPFSGAIIFENAKHF